MAYSSRPTANPHRKMYVPYVHVEQVFKKRVMEDPFAPASAPQNQPAYVPPISLTVPNAAPTSEALFAAVRANKVWIVAEMLGKIDLNGFDENHVTLLLIAARQNSLAMVALLLLGGADPSIGNNNGIGPIAVATQRGSHDMLTLLLAAKNKGISGQKL